MLGTAAAALRSTPFASALLKRERLQPSRRRPAQTAEAEDILKRSAGYVRLITPRKAETDKIDEESAPAQNVPDITPRHGLLKGEGPQDDGGCHRPAALPAHGGSVDSVPSAVTDISALEQVHLQQLVERYMQADTSGQGLDKHKFIECFSEVLPDMTVDQLATLFMKVDANSDGSVSWEEFSTYILDAGKVSEANAGKQSGGSLLHDPATAALYFQPHANTIALVAYHADAPRFVTIAADAKAVAAKATRALTKSAERPVEGKQGTANRDDAAANERKMHDAVVSQSKEPTDWDAVSRKKYERPLESEIRMWNNAVETGKILGQPATNIRANLTGAAAVVLAATVLGCRHELRNRSQEYIVAVASADSVVRFYDMDKLHVQAEMQSTDIVCTALEPFSLALPGQSHRFVSLLACGDGKGRLHILSEASIGAALGGRGSAAAPGAGILSSGLGVPQIDYGACTVSVNELASAQKHMEHGLKDEEGAGGLSREVTSIAFVESKGILVCGSSDGHVYVIETRVGLKSLALIASRFDVRSSRAPHGHRIRAPRLNEVLVFSGHHLAVKKVVWCAASKTIASAGLDRVILIWEPHNGHLVSRLEGHKKAIVALQYRWVLGGKDILVSLDRRGECNFWDASGGSLLMNVSAIRGAENFVGNVLMHKASDSLIFLMRRPVPCAFKQEQQVGEIAMLAHKQPLLDVCVDSEQFHQALCIDSSGLVTVWSLATGMQSFSVYAHAPKEDHHESPQDPTAVAFDDSFRRLLVGFSRGACRVYNYSNGSVIHDLLSDATAEITNICCTPMTASAKNEQFILACGWNCVTWVWPAKGEEYAVEVLFKLAPSGPVGQLESLTTQQALAGSVLLTGSQDGVLRLWNLNTRSEFYTAQLVGNSPIVRLHARADVAVSRTELKSSFATEKGPDSSDLSSRHASPPLSCTSSISHSAPSLSLSRQRVGTPASSNARGSRPSSSLSVSRQLNMDSSQAPGDEASGVPRVKPAVHSMSSVIAPSSLGGAGGGDNTLVVGASDGFRLFSHGTRWHPWAFVGVNQHPAWKLPPPPRSADEPEDTVDTEADVLMTSFAPISVEGSGRLLLCTGNTHGWIHLFDLSTIRKPRRWEDEMTNSGVDSISGKAVLADVSKDLTCLLRWQAYTDAPVAGLKMMRQLNGVSLNLVVSHPGDETESRQRERKRAELRRHLQEVSQCASCELEPLRVPGSLMAQAKAQGGASVWFLDGQLMGTIARSSVGTESHGPPPGGSVGGQSGEGDRHVDASEGWVAEDVLTHIFGAERARAAAGLASAAAQARFSRDRGLPRRMQLYRAAEHAAAAQAQEAAEKHTQLARPHAESSSAHGHHALGKSQQCDPISADESVRTTVRLVDAASCSFSKQMDAYAEELRRRHQLLLDADKSLRTLSSGGGQLGAATMHEATIPAAVASEEEQQAWIRRPGNFFKSDTLRKRLKQVDDEMEAFRFLGRNSAAVAPALEFLSQQRVSLLRSVSDRASSPTDGDASCSSPKGVGGAMQPVGGGQVVDGMVGIAAAGTASGLVAQELAHVLEAGRSTVPMPAPNSVSEFLATLPGKGGGSGRSLPRGLGGARSASAVPGHRCVGVTGRRTSSFTPSAPVGGDSIVAKASNLGPLVHHSRHARRWEADPFRNLITFSLTDVGSAGGRGGKKSLKKKKRREEEEIEVQEQSHAKSGREGLSPFATKLRSILQNDAHNGVPGEAQASPSPLHPIYALRGPPRSNSAMD